MVVNGKTSDEKKYSKMKQKRDVNQLIMR